MIRKAKSLFRDMLASSYSLLHWQGQVFSQAQAKSRIYFDCLPRPRSNGDRLEEYTPDLLRELRPFVIVSSQRALLTSQSAPGGFRPEGTLIATFHQSICAESEAELADEAQAFEAWMGELLVGRYDQAGSLVGEGLAQLSARAQDGFLPLISMQADGPFATSPEAIDQQGPCLQFDLTVTYGIRE